MQKMEKMEQMEMEQMEGIKAIEEIEEMEEMVSSHVSFRAGALLRLGGLSTACLTPTIHRFNQFWETEEMD